MTRQQQIAGGAAALCLGSWLLYQAYEGSGHRRPFLMRFLPGA